MPCRGQSGHIRIVQSGEVSCLSFSLASVLARCLVENYHRSWGGKVPCHSYQCSWLLVRMIVHTSPGGPYTWYIYTVLHTINIFYMQSSVCQSNTTLLAKQWIWLTITHKSQVWLLDLVTCSCHSATLSYLELPHEWGGGWRKTTILSRGALWIGGFLSQEEPTSSSCPKPNCKQWSILALDKNPTPTSTPSPPWLYSGKVPCRELMSVMGW